MHFKDAGLAELAERANVAQFVSFAPDLTMRYARVRGHLDSDPMFDDLQSAVTALLESSVDASVNVRSFDPTSPKSREFVYGLRKPGDVVHIVRRLATEGLYTIVNETVDISDGGVSGVLLGDVIEFAPEDTPRAVEKPGIASLPREVGLKLLSTVYGFAPELDFPRDQRVEFSLHPLRRGVRSSHTLVWEMERVSTSTVGEFGDWPNRFSSFLGDKAFGLLVADAVGLPVPRTTVFGRKIAPFCFGTRTATGETWIRTVPTVQTPGKYSTRRGWLDPFALLSREDPEGTKLAGVLSQDGVDAVFSGAALAADVSGSIELTIEGTDGLGEDFMVGLKQRVRLPEAVHSAVRQTYEAAARVLGPVRFEWVYDGARAWVVQLHRGLSTSHGRVIVPGDPARYLSFDVSRGLEALRNEVDSLSPDEGVELVGNVGLTSHFGDVLRKAGVPSYIKAT